MFSKLCLTLGLCIALAAAFKPISFEEFAVKHGKSYVKGSDEYSFRKQLFEENQRAIVERNKVHRSWTEEVNQFSDLTEEELKSFRGYAKSLTNVQFETSHVELLSVTSSRDLKELPKSVDWRKSGILTPVKNQGKCGSCWAFTTIETVEAHLALATGVLTELSEQQLVSCMPNPLACGGQGGCHGATMELGFQYIAEVGITSEWEYSYGSYHGENVSCKSNNTVLAKVGGFVALPTNDYAALMTAVATVGPIAVTVDSSSWHSYKGGVYDGCNQTNIDLNHAVQLVGYGYDETVKLPYWLIRNSWGPNWGENGFIRLRRHDDQNSTPCGVDITPLDGSGCIGGPEEVVACGTCGVLYDSSYPTGLSLVRPQ